MAKKPAKGRAGTPLPAESEAIPRSNRSRNELADEMGSPVVGAHGVTRPTTKLKPSALLDTRVIYCGDNLEHLQKLPDTCLVNRGPRVGARNLGHPECESKPPREDRASVSVSSGIG